MTATASTYTPIPVNLTDPTNASYDVNHLDSELYPVVELVAYRICADQKLPGRFREAVNDILLGMIDTHKAIRLLLGKIDEGDGIAVDSISLARNNIESLCILAWLWLDPNSNTAAFERDGWLKQLERAHYLEQEMANMPSQETFYARKGRQILDTWGKSTGLSTYEIQEAKDWIADRSKPRPKAFPRIPMAKDIVGLFIGSEFGCVIERFHKIEYGFVSQVPHSLALAADARRALRKGSANHPDNWDNWLQSAILDPSWLNSHLGILVAITFCINKVDGLRKDVDFMAKTTNAWKACADDSIPGKVIWDNWARMVFGAVG